MTGKKKTSSRKAKRKSKKKKHKKKSRRGMISKDRYITKEVRDAVWKRDEGRCVYCNVKQRRKYPLLREIKMEFGHVIPHSKGGNRCIDNIQLECKKCNRAKGATMIEVGWFKSKIMGRGAKGCKKKSCK